MSEIDKITNTDLNGRGVIGLPDTPGLTTTEMQNKLDEIAKDVLVPKVNELVENANATNTTLGTTDISGIGNGTVTGAIDTINSNLTTVSASGTTDIGTISCFKYGKIVTVTFSFVGVDLPATWEYKTLGTIPDEYFPPTTLGIHFQTNNNVQCFVRIEANGNISIQPISVVNDTNAKADYVGDTVTYVIR